MCDTIVALGNSTIDGKTLFGKNSDRPPNEAQLIVYYPSKEYESEDQLKCTYIEIPQVSKTHAVYLSKPHWMWGAEMGANEHGVVIGNEAVFSNEAVPETGLLGMDLLRLGLERGNTAKDTLDIIITLLETHGQGGVCEQDGIMMYHNSFIIADRNSAWVLETSDRRWVAEKVTDVRSISNAYTIGENWDFSSKDIINHAIEEGWCEREEDFNFAEAYGNTAMRYLARCDDRLEFTRKSLAEKKGELSFNDIASILQSHPSNWTPWNQEQAAVCQHPSHENAYSTTGSQISILRNSPVHLFTGSSSPCLSVYWPFRFEDPDIYAGFNIGGKQYNPTSYWWRREKINREIWLRHNQAIEMYPKIAELQERVLNLEGISDDQSDITRLIAEHETLLERFVEEREEDKRVVDEFEEYLCKLNKNADIP